MRHHYYGKEKGSGKEDQEDHKEKKVVLPELKKNPALAGFF